MKAKDVKIGQRVNVEFYRVSQSSETVIYFVAPVSGMQACGVLYLEPDYEVQPVDSPNCEDGAEPVLDRGKDGDRPYTVTATQCPHCRGMLEIFVSGTDRHKV